MRRTVTTFIAFAFVITISLSSISPAYAAMPTECIEERVIRDTVNDVIRDSLQLEKEFGIIIPPDSIEKLRNGLFLSIAAAVAKYYFIVRVPFCPLDPQGL